jgi:ribonuclease P protein component
VAGQTFRAADRVLRATDFERIYRSGRRLVCPSYAVFVLPNGIGRSRLGLTVTRKFGGAVKRNRNKRIVREIFRRNRAVFADRDDYIVNIRSAALSKTYTELERELLGVVMRYTRVQAK